MLKALAHVDNRVVLFCGLDRDNTTRLHDGKPIAVDITALLAGHPADEIQDLVIFAGDTLEDCHRELSAHIPLPDLPPAS